MKIRKKQHKYINGLWRSMKIYGDLWRSMEIYEDLWRSMKIYEDLWRSMKIYEDLYEDLWRSIWRSIWRSMKIYEDISKNVYDLNDKCEHPRRCHGSGQWCRWWRSTVREAQVVGANGLLYFLGWCKIFHDSPDMYLRIILDMIYIWYIICIWYIIYICK